MRLASANHKTLYQLFALKSIPLALYTWIQPVLPQNSKTEEKILIESKYLTQREFALAKNDLDDIIIAYESDELL